MGVIFKKYSLCSFRENEAGSILVIFSLALFALVGILALSINGSQVQSGYLKNQAAADAAALATADFIVKGKTDKIGQPGYEEGKWLDWTPDISEAKAYARQIYASNLSLDNAMMDSANGVSKFEVTFSNDKSVVNVTSCVYVEPLDIARAIVGSDRQEVCYSSEAGFALSRVVKDAEIAFVLDATYSMADENRMNNLTGAVKYVFNNYVTPENKDGLLFSIVPFAQYISVRPFQDSLVTGDNNNPVRQIPWFTLANTEADSPNPISWLGGDNFIPLTPMNGNKNFHENKTSEYWNNNTYTYLRNHLSEFIDIQPLTNDMSVLNGMIDGLRQVVNNKQIISGRTMGLTGILGGWLTLHSGWQGKWQGQSTMEKRFSGASFDRSALPSKSGAQKYIIFITDGEDTTSKEQLAIDNIEEDRWNKAYRDVCSAIQKQDIQIFMIFYGLPAQSYHKACQPDKGKRFENIPANKLQDVYEAIFDIIASEVQSVQLTNKNK